MSNMVLASTSPDTQLFWIIAPAEEAADGLMINNNGEMGFVSFWSVVTIRPDFTPVQGALLLNKLWTESNDDPEWHGKFVTQDIPLTEDELMSVEFLLVPVPDVPVPAEERPAVT